MADTYTKRLLLALAVTLVLVRGGRAQTPPEYVDVACSAGYSGVPLLPQVGVITQLQNCTVNAGESLLLVEVLDGWEGSTGGDGGPSDGDYGIQCLDNALGNSQVWHLERDSGWIVPTGTSYPPTLVRLYAVSALNFPQTPSQPFTITCQHIDFRPGNRFAVALRIANITNREPPDRYQMAWVKSGASVNVATYNNQVPPRLSIPAGRLDTLFYLQATAGNSPFNFDPPWALKYRGSSGTSLADFRLDVAQWDNNGAGLTPDIAPIHSEGTGSYSAGSFPFVAAVIPYSNAPATPTVPPTNTPTASGPTPTPTISQTPTIAAPGVISILQPNPIAAACQVYGKTGQGVSNLTTLADIPAGSDIIVGWRIGSWGSYGNSDTGSKHNKTLPLSISNTNALGAPEAWGLDAELNDGGQRVVITSTIKTKLLIKAGEAISLTHGDCPDWCGVAIAAVGIAGSTNGAAAPTPCSPSNTGCANASSLFPSVNAPFGPDNPSNTAISLHMATGPFSASVPTGSLVIAGNVIPGIVEPTPVIPTSSDPSPLKIFGWVAMPNTSTYPAQVALAGYIVATPAPTGVELDRKSTGNVSYAITGLDYLHDTPNTRTFTPTNTNTPLPTATFTGPTRTSTPTNTPPGPTSTPTRTPTPGYIASLGVVGVSDPNFQSADGTLPIVVSAHVDAGKSIIVHYVTANGDCAPFAAKQVRYATPTGTPPTGTPTPQGTPSPIANPFGFDGAFGYTGALRTVVLSSIGLPYSLEVGDVITVSDATGCSNSNTSRGAFITAWDGINGHTNPTPNSTPGAQNMGAGGSTTDILDGACVTTALANDNAPHTAPFGTPGPTPGGAHRLVIGTYGLYTSIDSVGMCGGTSIALSGGMCPASSVLPDFAYPTPTPNGTGTDALPRAGTLSSNFSSNRQVDASYTIQNTSPAATIQLTNRLLGLPGLGTANRTWTSVGCAYKEWAR